VISVFLREYINAEDLLMPLLVEKAKKPPLKKAAKSKRTQPLICAGTEKNEKVRDDIQQSWNRCSAYGDLSLERLDVPSEDEQLVEERWKKLNLERIAKKELTNIKEVAIAGSFVAAISDVQGNLLWTCASEYMSKKAEAINFLRAGIWDEQSAGTNAIGLSLKLSKPTTVFSSEHLFSQLYDWVGYASPITHPGTQEPVGVLGLFTTWNRHSVLGQSAVIQLASAIASHLPAHQPAAKLEINALGVPKVSYLGKNLLLSQRQIEILCLLALNPEGQSLNELHANLYGDQPICKSTLKAEISHLRKILGGSIGSRPYRLTVDTWCDFIDFWNLRRKKKSEEVISLYRGSFLPKTNSPVLEEWQRCIDVAMGQATKSCQDAALLTETMCNSYSGYNLIHERLFELLDKK